MPQNQETIEPETPTPGTETPPTSSTETGTGTAKTDLPADPPAAKPDDTAPGPENQDQPWLADIKDQELQTLLTKKGWHKSESATDALTHVLKSNAALEKKIGFDPSKVMDKPAEGQDRLEWMKENREALGLPEAPDGYEITRPELKAGVDWNDEMEAKAREKMHAAGATPQAMQAAVDLAAEMIAGISDDVDGEIESSRTKTMTQLQEDWGGQTGARVDEAKRAMAFVAEKAGLDAAATDALALTLKANLGDGPAGDAASIRLFHTIHQLIGEDAAVFPNDGLGGATGTTPAEARAEIEAMKSPEHAYAKAVKAGDARALKGFAEKRERLFKIAAQSKR